MSKSDSQDEYARERAERQRRQTRSRRKRVWEDRLATLLAGLMIAGGIIGIIILSSLLGAIGIYLGWNLGVFGLALAVHTSVLKISFWTALGTSFAIGVLGRLVRPNGVTLKREA